MSELEKILWQIYILKSNKFHKTRTRSLHYLTIAEIVYEVHAACGAVHGGVQSGGEEPAAGGVQSRGEEQAAGAVVEAGRGQHTDILNDSGVGGGVGEHARLGAKACKQKYLVSSKEGKKIQARPYENNAPDTGNYRYAVHCTGYRTTYIGVIKIFLVV